MVSYPRAVQTPARKRPLERPLDLTGPEPASTVTQAPDMGRLARVRRRLTAMMTRVLGETARVPARGCAPRPRQAAAALAAALHRSRPLPYRQPPPPARSTCLAPLTPCGSRAGSQCRRVTVFWGTGAWSRWAPKPTSTAEQSKTARSMTRPMHLARALPRTDRPFCAAPARQPRQPRLEAVSRHCQQARSVRIPPLDSGPAESCTLADGPPCCFTRRASSSPPCTTETSSS